MPGRASKLVLAAGSIVVLALAIGLVQLTRSAMQAATPTPIASHGPATTPPAPLAEHPASRAPVIAAREHHPVPTAPRGQGAIPVKQPELAPAPAGSVHELKRDANGHLVPIFPVNDLRAQLSLTDAPMKACIERSGQRPTGKATLGFTVATNSNKLVIASTGIQDDETLTAYPELLACMHQTSNALAVAFDGRSVPELGTAIYVRRHVRLENGVLAENSIFNFSYSP